MVTDTQINERKPRLNPFAFPSDTDFRFVILIVATLSASLFIYFSIYLLIPVNLEINKLTYLHCIGNVQAIYPQNTLSDQNALFQALAQCVTPVNLNAVEWIGLSLTLLLSVAGTIYWAVPNWKIWRGGLKPLQVALESPAMMATLASHCREAGLSRHPIFLLNPYDMTCSGVTFGRLGRYYVALNSGLVMQFQSDPAIFRAIVLHELGHIRNGDVDKTYFTIAISWAFGLVALVPWIVYQFIPPWHINDTLNYGWRILILTGLIYFTRNAVLRTREVYADVRASVWDGRTDALRRILNAPSSLKGRRQLPRLLRVHPAPQWRLQVISDTSGLFRQNFWDIFVTGIITGSVISDLQWLFTLPNIGNIGNIAFSTLGSAFIFAFLIVGIVGLGTWRATFSNQACDQPPPGTILPGLSLGIGLLLGQTLSIVVLVAKAGNIILPVEGGYFSDLPSLSGLTWSSLPGRFGATIFWGLLLLILLWLFFKWVVDSAASWLRISPQYRSPRKIYLLALVVESIALAIALAQFSEARDTASFAANTTNPIVQYVLVKLGVSGSVGGFASIILVILILATDPLTLIALICLWAYLLATWLWRKRTTRVTESSWAFLDTSSSSSPRPLPSSAEWMSLRPGLALGVGIAGGLTFLGMLVFFNGIKLGISSNEFLLLGVLVMVGIGAIVAVAIRRLGGVHSLFSIFVAGCVMALGTLIPGLSYSGVGRDQASTGFFIMIVNLGTIAALPAILVVSALAEAIRRLFRPKAQGEYDLSNVTSDTL